jgi:hypothetical protein
MIAIEGVYAGTGNINSETMMGLKLIVIADGIVAGWLAGRS